MKSFCQANYPSYSSRRPLVSDHSPLIHPVIAFVEYCFLGCFVHGELLGGQYHSSFDGVLDPEKVESLPARIRRHLLRFAEFFESELGLGPSPLG